MKRLCSYWYVLVLIIVMPLTIRSLIMLQRPWLVALCTVFFVVWVAFGVRMMLIDFIVDWQERSKAKEGA